MPSGGKETSQSQASQEVWSPYANAVSPMLEQSGDMFNKSMENINDPSLQNNLNQWNQGVQGGAANMWNQQSQGGNLAGYDITGALSNSLGGAMGGPTNEQQAIAPGMNNYADAYKQNFVDDASTAQASMLQGLDARAAASGMSGGSRHGVGMAQGMQDINSNLQSNLANVGYQDYTRNMERQQQAGANADQARLKQQQMLGGLVGQQNQSQQGALAQSGAMAGMGNLGYQSAMAPFMAYSQMLQGMGPSTVLGSSESDGKSMNFGV